MHLFVSCPPKLESLLTEELTSLNIPARKWPRGVSVPLSMENVYRVNLESRLATRVLWPMKTFSCTSRETLYQEALAIEWEKWLPPASTFAIDANVTGSEAFKNSHFAALVIKDAICDYFREKTGTRPSIDIASPTVQFNFFLYQDRATLSFDTSGPPLFKRGYRASTIDAPLQETLAAAILKLAQYTAHDILCDPFCGSGTLLFEAAMIASSTPPSAFRRAWGFFHHPDFSKDAFDALFPTHCTLIRPYTLIGGDRDSKAIDACRATQSRTQFPIYFERTDIRLFRPPQMPTLVVTNPPYGVRLKNAEDPYLALAHFLNTTCQGRAAAAVLSPFPHLPRIFKGKMLRPIPLVNGGLDVFLHLIEATS